jgi:hypothetical protein
MFIISGELIFEIPVVSEDGTPDKDVQPEYEANRSGGDLNDPQKQACKANTNTKNSVSTY